LVTSRATAALQDMLKVLRRFAWLDLMLYHVPVQGEQAAGQIASALDDLARRSADLGGIDLILLGRGGGSLEDLWAFNEEIVARAVAASPIPIITGVGHEVDVTIADLVADYHAHTPTEAAQVATRRWRSIAEDLETMDSRLRSDARDALKNARQSLDAVLRHEFFRRPTDRINHLRQRIDDLESRIQKLLHQQLTRRQQHLHALALRLAEQSPRHLLARNHQRLAGVELRLLQQHPRQMIRLKAHELTTGASRLNMAIRSVMNTTQNRITQIDRHLNAIGPRQVLARGYSITTLKKGGIIVRTTQQVKPGQRLVTRLADGEFESVAEDPNQPTLFE
jgi:exodeoxyribonuclease VII large subunit